MEVDFVRGANDRDVPGAETGKAAVTAPALEPERAP